MDSDTMDFLHQQWDKFMKKTRFDIDTVLSKTTLPDWVSRILSFQRIRTIRGLIRYSEYDLLWKFDGMGMPTIRKIKKFLKSNGFRLQK